MVACGGYRPSDARPKSWQIAETRGGAVPPPQRLPRRLSARAAPPSAIIEIRVRFVVEL